MIKASTAIRRMEKAGVGVIVKTLVGANKELN